jgi:hypothetical protein
VPLIEQPDDLRMRGTRIVATGDKGQNLQVV